MKLKILSINNLASFKLLSNTFNESPFRILNATSLPPKETIMISIGRLASVLREASRAKRANGCCHQISAVILIKAVPFETAK